VVWTVEPDALVHNAVVCNRSSSRAVAYWRCPRLADDTIPGFRVTDEVHCGSTLALPDAVVYQAVVHYHSRRVRSISQ
jgi:hypothetical protein